VTDSAPASVPQPKKPWFTFTDDGCRTEVRLGGLLVAAGVFLWLWLGPPIAGKLCGAGMLLLLVGVPIQAVQTWSGRPGYPWKLGLGMAVLGGAMWPDLTYRLHPDGPLAVQEIAWFLAGSGAWILLWWPVSRLRKPAL
jgi:hypothetical protein